MRSLLSHDLVHSAVLTIGVTAMVVSRAALGMRFHIWIVIMFGLPMAFVLAQLPRAVLFAVGPAGGGLGLAGLALFMIDARAAAVTQSNAV